MIHCVAQDKKYMGINGITGCVCFGNDSSFLDQLSPLKNCDVNCVKKNCEEIFAVYEVPTPTTDVSDPDVFIKF